MSAGIHGDSARTLVCDVIIDPISPPRSGFMKHSKQAEALQKEGQDGSIFWISRSWRCSTPTTTTPPSYHGHVNPSNSQQDLYCWHWKYNRNRQHLCGWQYNWHTNQCTQSHDHLHNYGWACFFWRCWLSSAIPPCTNEMYLLEHRNSERGTTCWWTCYRPRDISHPAATVMSTSTSESLPCILLRTLPVLLRTTLLLLTWR